MSNKERYDRVTVNAKVLMVSPKAQISDGLWKQDVHIADSMTSTKLILFENKIDSLVKGETYKFENILVNEFQHEKYLQVPRNGSTGTKIEELPNVVAHDDVPDTFPTVLSAEIVGVLSLDSYISCLNCKSKITISTDTTGKCNKCSLIQSLRHSTKQLRAKVIISTPGGNYLTLDVFGQNVAAIAEIDEAEVTADNLISAQPFSCSYNGTVMNSVTRP